MSRSVDELVSERRAVSAVISHMILLLTVVSTMGAVLVWATQEFVYPRYQSALKERLVVEDAWFKPGGEIELYVRNTGKVDLKVVTAYVSDKLASEPNFHLSPKQGGRITVTPPGGWISGQEYTLLFITERGSSFEVVQRAPE